MNNNVGRVKLVRLNCSLANVELGKLTKIWLSSSKSEEGFENVCGYLIIKSRTFSVFIFKKSLLLSIVSQSDGVGDLLAKKEVRQKCLSVRQRLDEEDSGKVGDVKAFIHLSEFN
jgi:hypothetical protein